MQMALSIVSERPSLANFSDEAFSSIEPSLGVRLPSEQTSQTPSPFNKLPGPPLLLRSPSDQPPCEMSAGSELPAPPSLAPAPAPSLPPPVEAGPVGPADHDDDDDGHDKGKVSRWQIGSSSLSVLEQVYSMEPFPSQCASRPEILEPRPGPSSPALTAASPIPERRPRDAQ